MSHWWIAGLAGTTVLVLTYGLLKINVALGTVRLALESLLSWSARERYQRWLYQAGMTRWVAVDLFALRLSVSVISLFLTLWISHSMLLALTTGSVAWVLVWWWIKSKASHYQQRLTAELPAFLDLLCLCMSSGMNLQTAMALVLDLQGQGATAQGDLPNGQAPGLATHWRWWLSAVCSGTSRRKAFEQLMSEVSAPAIRRVCVAMMQAEQAGAGMTASLMVQADQLRQERLMTIERKATQAPVKMLLPLVVCFFPSTFLVLGFSMWISLANSMSGFS